MSYADRNVGASRGVAIVLVAVILFVVGYGFVTGLAYKYVKKAAEKLNTFDVQEPPPPPEELPPPPPEQNVPPPPTNVVLPPAIVPVPQPPPPFTMAPTIPPAPPPSAPPAPPAPPPPPAQPAVRAMPRGDPNDWVTAEDYPPAALRSGDQGTVGFRLDIGTDGKVTQCTVTSSSGSSLLDGTACNLLKRRGRFTPAKDASGNAVAGAYISRFKWVVPQD